MMKLHGCRCTVLRKDTIQTRVDTWLILILFEHTFIAKYDTFDEQERFISDSDSNTSSFVYFPLQYFSIKSTTLTVSISRKCTFKESFSSTSKSPPAIAAPIIANIATKASVASYSGVL
jgi:hypothetical protein